MALLASINSDLSTLWRVSFGVTAALGLLEIVLYRLSGDVYTRGAIVLRGCGLVLYVLIAAVRDPSRARRPISGWACSRARSRACSWAC